MDDGEDAPCSVHDRPALRRTLMFLSFVLAIVCIVVGSLNLHKCQDKLVPAFPLVMGICIILKLSCVTVRSYNSLGNFSCLVLLFFIAAGAVSNTRKLNGRYGDQCEMEVIKDTLYVTIGLSVPMTVFWCWSCITCYNEPAFFCDTSVVSEYTSDSE